MSAAARTEAVSPPQPPPLGWTATLLIFGAAALGLLLCTRVLIPWLSRTTGMETVLSWFLAGGLLVFAPLLLAALLLLRQERGRGLAGSWEARLRCRRMNRGDWLWGVGALILIALLTAALQAALGTLLGRSLEVHPPFMAFETLAPGRYWILGAWLPFWILNIGGEEVLWRGVLLPRQEAALGRRAWIANAGGWTLFHVAFGWQLLALLLPILVVLPYVAQRRGNTWVAVLVHAGLNGPAFVAVALGLG